jgi:uncharacterized protein (TIGR00303 family)
LGLEIKPKLEYFTQHNFDIDPSDSIAKDANIDAQKIFRKGLNFGQSYQCQDEYLILAESVPSGTTTALATALGLGYRVEGMFSSSFKNRPNDIKDKTIKLALSNITNKNDIFNTLGKVGDNMLIFNAGFLMGLNNKYKVILAGGTQMACVLLVMNKILKLMGGRMNTSNLALCTTKWIAEDKNSDIEELLKMLSFSINAFYADFDFSLSEHPALKLYDEGEAKEGVGAGGALVYGFLNGLNKQEITKQIEKLLI